MVQKVQSALSSRWCFISTPEMSLSPSNIFDVSALPTIFLEARIHGCSGQAEELITQLGLSLTSGHVDVAVFSRFLRLI